MNKNSKIYVAGHTGMVGSAIVKRLKEHGYNNLILKTHAELELMDSSAVSSFFQAYKPEYVIDAAAKVGGIQANSQFPAEFFYENMQIQQNLIWNSYKHGVEKFLFLGSACMYPKKCLQPMTEDLLLTGLPEETNEGYALAKICGQRLCSYLNKEYGIDFITAIPANAYGMNDCFDANNSHVIPALIKKIYYAKQNKLESIVLWGTGSPKREFINTSDLAEACIFLMTHYSNAEPINVGTNEEISIIQLARLLSKIMKYTGDIKFDSTKPDGMMRRTCNSKKIIDLGWRPLVSLESGLEEMCEWYCRYGK